MERIILSISLFLFFNLNVANAQYKSVFSDSSQYWKVYTTEFSLGAYVYADSLYLGDSISSQQHSYREIWASTMAGFIYPQRFGYLREDTNQGKLWFSTDTTLSTQHLVYDLSLSVGDTFEISVYSQKQLVVEKIDSIHGRKRLKLRTINNRFQIVYPFLNRVNYYIDSLYFIEGVGSSNGLDLRNSMSSINKFSRLLLCHYVDSVQTFQHNLSDSLIFLGQCDTVTPPNLVSITEEVMKVGEIFLYPNPTFDIIHLNTNLDISEVSLYDFNGRLEKSYESEQKILSLPEKSGVYILQLTTSKGKVINKKVIKY